MLKLALLTIWLIIESSDAGTSFIRWGRTVCPAGSQKLYKGYMAGKPYGEVGSGANYLCAHEEPQFLGSEPGRTPGFGVLRGVELWTNSKNLYNTQNIPGGELLGQDLPCVLCYVADSTDKIMIPGRLDCGGTGYDLMYSGYLSSEALWGGRQPSEYICVDGSPEGRTGGSEKVLNNAIIYPVEVHCGTLPCNPFIDGKEMTCAVCTY